VREEETRPAEELLQIPNEQEIDLATNPEQQEPRSRAKLESRQRKLLNVLEIENETQSRRPARRTLERRQDQTQKLDARTAKSQMGK
jgi:hypothetical protein